MKETFEVNSMKFTTRNKGSSVRVRGHTGGKGWRRVERRLSKERSKNQYRQSLHGTNLHNFSKTTSYSRSTDPMSSTLTSRSSDHSFLHNSPSERSRLSDSGLLNVSGQSMLEQTRPVRYTDNGRNRKIEGSYCKLFVFLLCIILFLFCISYFKT